jgi:hypothetical protein
MDAAAFVCSVTTVSGCTTPSEGASRAPSSAYSADATATVGGTLTDDAEDAPMPTLPASGATSAGSWGSAGARGSSTA